MKALVKLLMEFIAWRWAPAVALLTASTLYVIVVVGVVPSEIGAPVANTKFVPRDLSAGTSPNETTSNANTYAATTAETPFSPPPVHHTQVHVADFGRRGFSPPIDRPEPPPGAPAPAPPPPTATPSRGTFTNIFNRIQGAIRPGSPATQMLNQAAQRTGAPGAPAAPGQAAPGAVPPPQPLGNAPVPPPAAAAPAPAPPPDNAAPPAAAPPAEGAPPAAAPDAPAAPEAPPGQEPPAQ